MKVVALLSGGKDSCYSILKCRSYDHEVVALAHIITTSTQTDEVDSFMYQSVGSNMITSLATCLNLPLYTRRTCAVAMDKNLVYSPVDGDEVEDLYELLQDVRNDFPEVEGVCAGAIWSDYQRLRVESAASRLGLVSLAFLWRRSQRLLLREMIDMGVEAVLIKVAGFGLKKSDLGKNLGDMRERLEELEEKFGCHVCGEGGEYETLVLDIPGFRKKIVVDKDRVVTMSDDKECPVAFLVVKEFHLEDKVDKGEEGVKALKPIEVQEAYLAVEGDVYVEKDDGDCSRCDERASDKVLEVNVSVGYVESYAYVSVQTSGEEPLVRQVARSIELMKTALDAAGNEFHIGDVFYCWFQLSDVSAKGFKSANEQYVYHFEKKYCTPPPARACVEINVPSGCNGVTLEVIARHSRGDRALHVQSISEWAPPCIGPYSQAITLDGIVHVCGIIPMYPPTGAIPNDLGARAQTRACFRNIEKTFEALPTSCDRIFLLQAYIVSSKIGNIVEEEIRGWKYFREGEFLVDTLPVSALPKGALIELQVSALEKDTGEISELVKSSEGSQSSTSQWKFLSVGRVFSYIATSSTSDTAAMDEILDGIKQARSKSGSDSDNILSVRLYTTKDSRKEDLRSQIREAFPSENFAISIISTPFVPVHNSAKAWVTLTSKPEKPEEPEITDRQGPVHWMSPGSWYWRKLAAQGQDTGMC